MFVAPLFMMFVQDLDPRRCSQFSATSFAILEHGRHIHEYGAVSWTSSSWAELHARRRSWQHSRRPSSFDEYGVELHVRCLQTLPFIAMG